MVLIGQRFNQNQTIFFLKTKSKDFYNVIVSNFDKEDKKDKTYLNESLLKQIIMEIDPEHFNLRILNDVFKSFLSSQIN